MRNQRRSLNEWMSIITECRRSGLSDAAWCEQNDISVSCFYNAVSRLRKKACEIPASSGKTNVLDITSTKQDVVEVSITSDIISQKTLACETGDASDEEKARLALDRVTEKWTAKYPNSMKRWYDNRDAITPIFKFLPNVRKVIYTTNTIESLNSIYRKLNRQRSVFPSDTELLKDLYLATFEATKKWTMRIRNWGQVYGELSIMYEGRLPE